MIVALVSMKKRNRYSLKAKMVKRTHSTQAETMTGSNHLGKFTTRTHTHKSISWPEKMAFFRWFRVLNPHPKRIRNNLNKVNQESRLAHQSEFNNFFQV